MYSSCETRVYIYRIACILLHRRHMQNMHSNCIIQFYLYFCQTHGFTLQILQKAVQLKLRLLKSGHPQNKYLYLFDDHFKHGLDLCSHGLDHNEFYGNSENTHKFRSSIGQCGSGNGVPGCLFPTTVNVSISPYCCLVTKSLM